MNTKKILNEEIKDLRVSSLPSRPTAPSAFGGRGYTSAQMKEAFDRLPVFIIERFNSLLDDVSREGEGGIADEIKTGISEGHTLRELFSDVLDGSFASYLTVGEETLEEYERRADELFLGILSSIEEILGMLKDSIVDCGSPGERKEEAS